jgi:glyoxylase-like metal-dependent hydrolase (beta-lactamase superfamily II)
MTDHPQSPNGLWAKHGYTIQREPRGYGSSMIRTITAPDGEAVLVDAGFEGEMQWIRENLEADNAIINAGVPIMNNCRSVILDALGYGKE